jgi:hypothetical protein
MIVKREKILIMKKAAKVVRGLKLIQIYLNPKKRIRLLYNLNLKKLNYLDSNKIISIRDRIKFKQVQSIKGICITSQNR